MINHEDLLRALLALRPNAEWVLHGPGYETLEWRDSNQTKPTLQEVQDFLANN